MLAIAMLVGRMLQGEANIGHVATLRGSSSFTSTTVFSTSVNLALGKDGEWRGRVGKDAVDFAHSDGLLAGENIAWYSGRGTRFAVIHHKDKWYCKGVILGTPVLVIWPDNEPLDGWRQFRFDGIASRANPPFVPLVLAMWAAEVETDGRSQPEPIGDVGDGGQELLPDVGPGSK